MTRPARTIRIAISIAFVLAAGFVVYFLFAPDSWLYSRRIALGNRDAFKIDAYRQRTGRVPARLEDLGVDVSEDGPICYERCSDTRYILWFGTTLGESMSFDSAKRTWVSLNIVCSEGQ
ncbi:MAG TPA: hypothetical protein VGJ21_09970 [Terracidiphilus sp.]|jgi:hypothetical protein